MARGYAPTPPAFNAMAARRSRHVSISPKIALPLVAVVFALLNTGLYWLLKPVLTIATLGIAGLVVPFLANGLLLLLTDRLVRPLQIRGLVTVAWLSLLLTIAHGVLAVALDVSA